MSTMCLLTDAGAESGADGVDKKREKKERLSGRGTSENAVRSERKPVSLAGAAAGIIFVATNMNARFTELGRLPMSNTEVRYGGTFFCVHKQS